MAAEEEEALKRNTDCVYFLASPLTCKKGSECEYRHSDIARVNPTDCWYWLNANCLNPSCAFRHPPLDGLMETQMPTSTGSAVAQPQGVPCKFFQGGFCLKGHWCPFLHAPNSVKNKAYAASITEPLNTDKVEIPVLEKKVPPTRKGEVKPIKKVAGEVKPDVPINELSRNKRMRDTSCMEELPDYNSNLVSNGSMVSPFISVQQPYLVVESSIINNKDEGDVSREPSPGFDVLVDDEGRGSDFYHKEDQYGMPREYTAINRYEIDHLSDYSMSGEADNDWYRELQGYPKGQYGFERNEASPERMSAGFYHKRRLCARDELDLRHHLTRNKKPHGLKSIIINKGNDDHSREGLNFPSNRLRGRIRLPPRSSSPIDRRDDNGRLSSVRACLPSNHGCIKERVKARVEEPSSDGLKNHRGWHSIRDMNGDNNADFAGPKSLAELKNRKNAEPSRDEVMDQQQLGKRKQSEHYAFQQNVDVFSFEGPKPLEEILKKKRGETSGMVNRRDSSASLKSESSCCDGKKEAILFASIERNGAEESGYSHYVGSKQEACEQKKEFNPVVDNGVGFDMCCGEGNALMMMATATRLQ